MDKTLKLSAEARAVLTDRHAGSKVMDALNRGEGAVFYPENVNALVADLIAAIAELLGETEAFGDEQRAGLLVAEFARHRTLIAAARQQETVISDEVVDAMVLAYETSSDLRSHAMRAALSLLPVRVEGSSRSQPSRTTQESPSPTPCDLEGK